MPPSLSATQLFDSFHMDLSRTLSATVIAYGLLAVGMLRWHFSYGPPYYQTTLGLLVVFAVSAALVGLLSVWAALGMLHWAKRASWFTVAASAMAALWLLFFEWNQYLIWQMVVLLAVQMACLVVVLGICRVFGLGVLRDKSTSGKAGKSSQLSIRDLLVLTAALAIFFAVLGIGHPVELERDDLRNPIRWRLLCCIRRVNGLLGFI